MNHQQITSNPITRMEDHSKIEIFLNEEGDAADTRFIVPDLRELEQVCIGRPVEEMPRITSQLYGVWPEAHQMAATKALDALFDVLPKTAVCKIRELYYLTFFVTAHTNRYYALGGPDFVPKPDALTAQRNAIEKQVIECRRRNRSVIQLMAGRGAHPVAGQPGGWSRPVTKEAQKLYMDIARQNIEFAQFCLKLFADVVLANPEYLELILSDVFSEPAYYMGMVDRNNHLNFYDGKIRVVAPDGSEFVKYFEYEYQQHVAEALIPGTYLKSPYLKQVGWKGLESGVESGVYCATPLSRLNAANGMATPLAQAEYEKMYETLGSEKVNGRYQPLHFLPVNHWARLIELLYAAERMLELARDPEITNPHTRIVMTHTPTEGVGTVTAPQGLLTHHYQTDERGILTHVNLIVSTMNNYAPILMSVKRAAQAMIQKGTVITEDLLNRIEMVFRAYDPCFACAPHSFSEPMPLEVTIHDAEGEVVIKLVR